MPKRPESESLYFDVEGWKLDYWISVNNLWRPGDLPGRCWETRLVKIGGRLRRRTKRWRRADRIELAIDGRGIEPEEWKEEYKGVGRVRGAKAGMIMAYLRLPKESFRTILSALTAGKVQRVHLHAEQTEERGKALIVSFGILDPEADEEDKT